MLTEPTLDRLRALHLGAMADAYRTQLQDPAIGGAQLRRTRRPARRRRASLARQSQAHPSAQGGQAPDSERVSRGSGLRAAPRTRSGADPPARHRPLDRRTPQRPHHRRHRRREDVRGCALGQHACRQGYRAIYRRLPRFFQELALARADGSYTTLLARFARVDVLVLDDWGLAALTDVQRQDLLEVMEDRDATRSTIITSQLPRDQWHAYLGEPTIADAVLDRLVHNAYPITLKGPSRRKDKAAAVSRPPTEPGRGRCQTHGRADAPTGLWKTARTRFPTPPTAIIVMKGEGRTQNRNVTVTLSDYHLEDEHR